MDETFDKNSMVEKLTNILGIAVRLIVIDPLAKFVYIFFLDHNILRPSEYRTAIFNLIVLGQELQPLTYKRMNHFD